jgi:2-dehydro-3-deoxygluconokinase
VARRKTVAFGEVLLRLNAPGYERLLQSPRLGATFGGAEANVAVSLAHLGASSHFVTRLPANAVGDAAVRALRAEGVEVDCIQRGGSRVGIYFTETGAGQRGSSVVYDRAGSAMAEIDPAGLPWREWMSGAAWFHTSGITPALGAGAAECTRAAIAAAREAGATVSLDLNYRAKLWDAEQARRVMRPLVGQVDLLVANEWHLETILGVAVERPEARGGQPGVDAYRAAAERVVREHGVRRVAVTLRESLSASENGWSALLYDGPSRTLHRAPRYVVPLVDRIGGGDSFVAGLVFALLDGGSLEDALRFAVAASVLKHTIPGDFNRVSAAEVRRLASGDESGRIDR